MKLKFRIWELGANALSDGGHERGFSGGGYSRPPVSTVPYPSSKSGIYSHDILSSYDKATRALAASISASSGPTSSKLAGGVTEYVGLSGSLVTPVGGAEIDIGFYSDSYGMVGGYFALGPAMGIPSGFLGVAKGRIQSLAGESISVSAGLSHGIIGVSKGHSIDPSTGDVTGEQWSAGLAIGPKVGVSGAHTTTTTTEFTSLYLVYIQFLNWVGYPSYNAARHAGHWY